MASITLAVSVCLLAGMLEAVLPATGDGGNSIEQLIDCVVEVSERSPI
jgi:hypothetical protein